MQHDVTFEARDEERAMDRRKRVLGIVGGVLYLVLALAIMQVAFFVWAGMWR